MAKRMQTAKKQCHVDETHSPKLQGLISCNTLCSMFPLKVTTALLESRIDIV